MANPKCNYPKIVSLFNALPLFELSSFLRGPMELSIVSTCIHCKLNVFLYQIPIPFSILSVNPSPNLAISATTASVFNSTKAESDCTGLVEYPKKGLKLLETFLAGLKSNPIVVPPCRSKKTSKASLYNR